MASLAAPFDEWHLANIYYGASDGFVKVDDDESESFGIAATRPNPCGGCNGAYQEDALTSVAIGGYPWWPDIYCENYIGEVMIFNEKLTDIERANVTTHLMNKWVHALCDASAAPSNGSVGNCTNSLASGSTCQPTCDSGYTVSGTSSCDAGTLTAATCSANLCSTSTDSTKDGSDGTFYCINGGTVGGTAGSCNCTSCDAGYEGVSCQAELLCSTNQRVKDNACISCPAGTANTHGGDDASGIDTTCDDIICGVNQYVSGNACRACPPGTTNADGGDIASGDETACDKTLCAADQHVFSNTCASCVGGSTKSEGDDASGEDTTCACATNERVVSNACVACDAGETNAAGNPVPGPDTACTKAPNWLIFVDDEYDRSASRYSIVTALVVSIINL